MIRLSCSASAGAEAVFAAGFEPVPLSFLHIALLGERHPGRKGHCLAGGNGARQLLDGSLDKQGKGGLQDGLPAADRKAAAKGKAIFPAEQLEHVDGDLVLPGLQKAAVDDQVNGWLVGEGAFFQAGEKVEHAAGQAVDIERKDKDQVGAAFQRTADVPVVLGGEVIFQRRAGVGAF